MNRCLDTLRGDRCALDLGHDGPHRNGDHTWRFQDTSIPEWRRRADEAVRARGLVAAKEVAP